MIGLDREPLTGCFVKLCCRPRRKIDLKNMRLDMLSPSVSPDVIVAISLDFGECGNDRGRSAEFCGKTNKLVVP